MSGHPDDAQIIASADATRSFPAGTHPWVAEGQRRVRFGLFGGLGVGWERLRDRVRTAEQLGFDAYFTGDHPAGAPDLWATLAALAVTTETIRMGSLVSCVDFRAPALLARLAADVDRMSGGRLVLGLGPGNNVGDDYPRLGFSWDPLPQRQARVAETVAVVRGLWGAEPFTHRGEHYAVTAGNVRPPPVQQPRVPILIAGGGERVTLRQVAEFADASNFGPQANSGHALGVEGVRRKLDALRRHCDALGRPYESVLPTYFIGPVICAETRADVDAQMAAVPARTRAVMGESLIGGTPAELIAHFRALVDAGVRYVIAMLPVDGDALRLIGQRVVPELTALS